MYSGYCRNAHTLSEFKANIILKSSLRILWGEGGSASGIMVGYNTLRIQSLFRTQKCLCKAIYKAALVISNNSQLL